MLRKLAAAIAIAGSVGGTLGAGAAHGLGLGDIRLNSALNQPLSAEIELVQVKDLTSGEVLSSMATREDFQRAGVERPYFLSDLSFETVTRENGTAFVKVTSRKPVVEPYLNFLLEVHWPSGRLLREYTLLLDPPSFSNAVVKDVATKSAAVANVPSKPKPATTSPVVKEQAAPEVASVAPAASSQTYTVKKNDTLWEVALSTRPSRDVSPVKMMSALQAENPSAFINGNINLLKQGSVLTIPDRSMIESLDAAAANQDVARQNKQWKEGRGKVQLDATRKTKAAETVRGSIEEDQLSIVTTSGRDSDGEGADQGDGQSAGGGTRELESAVSLNQEQLDTLSRENTDLKDRLRDLEDQISTLEKLVVVKSDQMVAKQLIEQQIAAAEEAAVQLAEAEKPAENIDYNYYEADPVTGSKADEMAAVAPVVPAGGQGGTPPIDGGAPAPIASGPAGVIDKLMDNPAYLGAAGGTGALVLALLALVALRRRKNNDNDDLVPAAVAAGEEQFDNLPEAEDMFAHPDEEATTGLTADTDLDIDQELLEMPEPTQPETTDALGEADIYIAYGRFDQASELLNSAIAREPQRTDLRIKQLEVQAELQDASAFLAQEKELENLNSNEGLNRASELRPRFPVGSFDVKPSDTVDSDTVTEAAFDQMDTSDLDDIPENEGLEFDLSDLEPAAEDSAEENTETSEFDLDFDSLEAELEEEVADDNLELPEFENLELPELQDLELDAALEMTLDEPVTAEPAVEVAESKEKADSLDFDSELEQLDAELANLSADLELDGESVEKALAPEMVSEAVVDVSEDTPVESPAPEIAAKTSADISADAIDDALAGLGESDSNQNVDQMEEDFSFLDDADETATKLDLARAYMEMGDEEGAKDILEEVAREGNEAQQQEAQGLMDKISR